jgi:nitrate/nitrite transporter NarK
VCEEYGSVSGMVGAGGNLGAIAFSLMFVLSGMDTPTGFRIMVSSACRIRE